MHERATVSVCLSVCLSVCQHLISKTAAFLHLKRASTGTRRSLNMALFFFKALSQKNKNKLCSLAEAVGWTSRLNLKASAQGVRSAHNQ